MTVRILHLTHTDICSDNRILKEIAGLAEISYFQLHGVGILQRQGGGDTRIAFQATIVSLDLATRKLRFLPHFLRHLLVALEMTIRLFFQGLKIQPHVVHCHDTPVLLVGALLKRFCKAKLVYDAHELESNKTGQSRIGSRFTFWIERFTWPSIDHFISVSPSIIKWYEQHLGPKPNSLVMNSPLFLAEADKRAGKPHYFHEKFNIPFGERIFLYLGLLGPGRGIDQMLEVFSSGHVTSHLVCMGYGPLAEKVRSVERTSDRVHWHPAVPPEDVVALSRSADFGLCIIENASLSYYYSLPNKLFEYAFAGIPVLASNHPDIAYLVDEYSLGEYSALDKGSITATVRRVEASEPKASQKDLHAIGWQSQRARLQQAYLALTESS